MTDSNVFDEGQAGEPTNGLSLQDAIKLLGRCTRYENRDHYFGDREVFWRDIDGEEVADGYFGGGSADVFIHEEYGGGSFKGSNAKALVTVGKNTVFGRNDETGPDYYGGA